PRRLIAAMSAIVSKVDDFVACPFEGTELFLRINRLFPTAGVVAQAFPDRLAEKRAHVESLVGERERFLEAIHRIPPLAGSDAPVLISGETGTGKELFARALHYGGPRHGKPLIPVNSGALPDHLFENELFGHAKGAFTDASAAQKGLIAEAEGGT